MKNTKRKKSRRFFLFVTDYCSTLQLKRIDDFNPQCKGNNWIRANVPDAKVLNEQLRLMLVQAHEAYQELASDGDVSSAKVIKNLDAEYVSPSFMAVGATGVSTADLSISWMHSTKNAAWLI